MNTKIQETKYEAPSLEVVELKVEDILKTSLGDELDLRDPLQVEHFG